MLEKFRKAAQVAAIVAAGFIGGQADANAQKHNEQGLDHPTQEQMEEKSFEQIALKNQNALNKELKSKGLGSVKVGEASEATRCGGVDFGIYTEKGEHLFDKNCTKDVFKNTYKFLDLVLDDTIEYLKAKEEGRNPDIKFENSGEVKLLLGIAKLDTAAKDFVTKNNLKLDISLVSGQPGICLKSSTNSDIEVDCYTTNVSSADFSYNKETNILHLVLDFGSLGFKLQKEFTPTYSSDGVLKKITETKETRIDTKKTASGK